jgi:probable rRNA maturation factor
MVFLLNDGVKLVISRKGVLKEFITSIFKSENRSLKTISIIFSSDSSVLKINKEYLKHNYLTDIITFRLSKHRQPIIADVYISTERVRENSQKLQSKFNEELHRVIFHGVLHLCGYNDKSKSQKLAMRERENYYLSKYFKKRFT